MDLIMQISNTKARAVAANEVALEVEQAKDALEREVQTLERAMGQDHRLRLPPPKTLRA